MITEPTKMESIEIDNTRTQNNHLPTLAPTINTNQTEQQNTISNTHCKISNIVDSLITPTPALFNSTRPPARSLPVLNPNKGDCHSFKHPDSLRMMTQNTNSLQPNSLIKWEGTLDRIKQLQIDITGLCEHRVNFNNIDVLKKFKDVIYKRTPGGSLTVSPVPTKYQRAYLPGGTLLLTVGKWRTFMDGDIFDPYEMGRWTGNTY
jgi:hypothetical protein